MTGTETCWVCQGEFPCEVSSIHGYKVVYGWCSECNQARLIWDDKAYEDNDFDVHSESDRIGKILYDDHYMGFKIIDTPDFQFKWTKRPTDAHDCPSCIHGFRLIVDGENKGQSCRKGLEPKWDESYDHNLCESYEPLDRWNNMGGQCRYCVNNCQQICGFKGNLTDVSDYDKGHCEHYRVSDIWWFERVGHTQCPIPCNVRSGPCHNQIHLSDCL